MDTAPTGHTLLLLDATGAYHREIARQMGGKGLHFTTPMMQLQDPKQTKVMIVTLPEPTPVQEAANLQADLRRAGIEPWAWVVNHMLSPASATSPCLPSEPIASSPISRRSRGAWKALCRGAPAGGRAGRRQGSARLMSPCPQGGVRRCLRGRGLRPPALGTNNLFSSTNLMFSMRHGAAAYHAPL